MTPTRRAVLMGLAATGLAGAGCGGRSAVERGVRWLLDQQGTDGGFRSVTYGFLGPGASLTGLSVLALARIRLTGVDVPIDALSRGLGFLVASRGTDGGLGLSSDVPDYPTYATALAVTALATVHPPGWREAAAPMVAWLQSRQLVGDAWGLHPSRGGFPMGGLVARTPPDAGHVDLSMTRHAVEALRAWGLPDGDAPWAEARRFVVGCGTSDGGFRYSPGEAATNKGRTRDAGYGTTTCDGVLALRTIGVRPDLEAAGVSFLVDRFRVDENPGIGEAYAVYGPAMRFYWRAGVARVLSGTSRPSGWRAALVGALDAEAHEDGSWRNARAEQKEDDPIVATALALLAYAAANG